MVKLIFQVDKKADIDIWLRALNDKSQASNYGCNWLDRLPKDFLDKVLNKPEEKQRRLIKKYISKYYTKENLDKFRIVSKQKIQKNKTEIIKRLEILHNRKLPIKKIVVKYETFTCCPYIWQGKDSDTFGLYLAKFIIDRNEECLVFAHELMHLFFHYYFFDYCLEKGCLSIEEVMEIKEAVTILLNHDSKLSKLIEFPEEGYLLHKPLIDQIEQEWSKQQPEKDKDKDFAKLLDSVIEKIKESK
jgi:hypothetical protein